MTNARFCIIPARALGDKRLNRTDIMVLNALGMFGDKEGWSFPSTSTIADMIDAHRTSVSKAIASLVECGYVESRPRYREDGGQTSNEYRILFDAPATQGTLNLDAPQMPASGNNTPVVDAPPPSGETATPPMAVGTTPPVADTPHQINVPNLTTQVNATHRSASAVENDFFQKAFDAGCKHHPQLKQAMASAIHQWQQAGADLELDVLPEIRRHEGKRITGWAYFTGGIMDSLALRSTQAPEGRKGKKHKPAENRPPDEHAIAKSYAWMRDRGMFIEGQKERFLEQYEAKHGKITINKPTPEKAA